MRQVPGNEAVERPLEEQADMLIKKLAGHTVFKRMRGRVQGFPLWELLDLDSKKRRPNRFASLMRICAISASCAIWSCGFGATVIGAPGKSCVGRFLILSI